MPLAASKRARFTGVGCLFLAVTAVAADQLSDRPTARTLIVRADSFLRDADFESAKRLYQSAAAIHPSNPRAQLGLGRIARLEFNRQAAHRHFQTAFRLDSHDPDILLAYSETAASPTELLAALRDLPNPHDPRISQVLARLQIAEATALRPLNHLAGPYQKYRLKLLPFLPINTTAYGVVLKVSLNGGKPLRLVLDTGARGIVASRKSTRGLNLEPIGDSIIGGLGAGAPKIARVTLARSLETGNLRLENCLVEITEDQIAPGADGIVGTDIFQEFLVRLDPWSYTLDLLPFADPDPQAPSSGFFPVFHVGHLLAAKTADGLFVLDTGSASSAVSPELLGNRRSTLQTMSGARGAIAVASAASPLVFRLSGGPALVDTNVVALDLTSMSEQQGTRISGLLGYSALNKLTISLNYRDGLVRLAPHEHSPKPAEILETRR